MIICHKYKFIYIKSMKTAGTSLEIALASFCDENDIISTDEEVEENLKKNYLRVVKIIYIKYQEFHIKI